MGGWQEIGEKIIMTSLIACPAVAMVTVGVAMVRSAVTGRGIEPPDEHASTPFQLQFALRGVIGGAFLLGGVAIIVGIVISHL